MVGGGTSGSLREISGETCDRGDGRRSQSPRSTEVLCWTVKGCGVETHRREMRGCKPCPGPRWGETEGMESKATLRGKGGRKVEA